MTIFDTDIASNLLQSRPAVVSRVAAIPAEDQAITIVTVEEILRGRLNLIRQAEAGKSKTSLEEAYALLNRSVDQFRDLRILTCDTHAELTVRNWRAAKIRIGTQDLRIAAIAFAHDAKLVTRNARDYALVPGLNLEVWN